MQELLMWIGRCVLRLRYRVRLSGMERVAAKGTRGILFLPNHPGLIDPPILMSNLYRRFTGCPVSDKDQMDKPLLRSVARWTGTLLLPDPVKGGDACRQEVERVLNRCIELLRTGENIILYPAGRIYRQRLEDLGGNSAVETILRRMPDVRVVLVRTRGLWGSMFGRASGRSPDLFRGLKKGLFCILANGILFAPRREVSIELYEADDLPRRADRTVINRYLERFYNQNAPPNTYVPYYFWEKGGARSAPEPARGRVAGDVESVPAATRDIVIRRLRELTGKRDIRRDQTLAGDLGLDSLARVELALWLEKEFGFHVGDDDVMGTVSDVLLAACGNVVAASLEELKPVPSSWFELPGRAPGMPDGKTVIEVFLARAAACPGQVAIADQSGGVRTYRDIVTAMLALKPEIERLPGTHVGILLPASVGATVLYLAVLASGKIPVMVNWTVGTRNMTHSLGLLDVRHVITARALVQRIEAQGGNLEGLRDRFLLLEDLGRRITKGRKILAALRSRLSWAVLSRAAATDTAVVLFTSGSESVPKAVPLSHANLLANARDMVRVFQFRTGDRLIGMLPPFHSFGITCTVVLPLCLGMRVVYHANPTEGGMLARLIEAYKVTLLVGTPTFLNGILRAASDEQLRTLRAVISGAEKCPPQVYETVERRLPNLVLLEGYGITECSPVVSVNDEKAPVRYTIGKPLPSVEAVIVDLETNRWAECGRAGMLLVRGPSVFSGYQNYEGPSPFVEFEGRQWYRTGDLVSQSADGVLTFVGRLKRFVKIGGEMISLPAIEEVLARRYASEADDKPVVAVEGTPAEPNPELVLFTVRDVDREAANQAICEAGLSPLHNIRTVVKLDEIPVLGTGKTHYRALKEMLRKGRSR